MFIRSVSFEIFAVSLCLAGCGSGGGSDGGGDSSSSTGEDDDGDDADGDATVTATMATTIGTDGSVDSGDSGDSGGSTDDGGTTPMPVGPCEDDPAPQDDQTGTPIALRTWQPNAGIDAMVIGDDGTRYIAGRFGGTIEFGEQTFTAIADDGELEGAQDTFLAALAPDGELVWLHQLHGDGSGVEIRALALSDNGFLHVGGVFSQSLWVDDMERGTWESTSGHQAVLARFTGSDGGVRWIRPITGDDSDLTVTQVLPIDGGVVAALVWLTGSWSVDGDPPFATNGGVGYLKLDGYGKQEWIVEAAWNNVASMANVGLQAVAEDRFAGAMWTEGFGDGSIPTVSVDGVLLQNDAFASSYLVEIDVDGKIEAATAIKTDADFEINGMATAPCGDLVLSGIWGGPLDLGEGPLGETGTLLWRRDPDGNTRWVVAEPGTDTYFSQVLVDTHGQVTVRGANGMSGRISRFSAAGEPLWETLIENGTTFGMPNAMAIAPDETVVTAGYYYSLSVPGFDDIPLPKKGDPVTSPYMIDLAP